MIAKRKAKPKPKPCKGCAHYRSETGSRGGEEICHYILDTGKPRKAMWKQRTRDLCAEAIRGAYETI